MSLCQGRWVFRDGKFSETEMPRIWFPKPISRLMDGRAQAQYRLVVVLQKSFHDTRSIKVTPRRHELRIIVARLPESRRCCDCLRKITVTNRWSELLGRASFPPSHLPMTCSSLSLLLHTIRIILTNYIALITTGAGLHTVASNSHSLLDRVQKLLLAHKRVRSRL